MHQVTLGTLTCIKVDYLHHGLRYLAKKKKTNNNIFKTKKKEYLYFK